MESYKIPCPYCGELNIKGSNICARCLRDIRHIANPEAEDSINTVTTPAPKISLSRKFKRWIKRIKFWR